MSSPHLSLERSATLNSPITDFEPDDCNDSEEEVEIKSVPRWVPLTPDSNTMAPLNICGVDDQTVIPEELSLYDLQQCLRLMEQSNETIRAENKLLENYLSSVDPTLIDNMDKVLEAATAAIMKAERNVQLGAMASAATLSQTSKGGQESTTSSPRSTGHTGGGSSKIAAFVMADKGPKIQPSQKIEIIQRESDYIKALFDDFQKRSHKKIFLMECREEECHIRLRDLEASRKNFESCLTKDWIDPVLLKVPGEKIISFFDMKNRSDIILKKTFLTRAKNLNIQHEAVAFKLKELGEGLHYVDYEQLLIQNEDVQTRLTEKLINLTHLKKNNSRCLSTLNKTRCTMFEKMCDTKKVQSDLMKNDFMIMKLLQDETRLLDEIHRRNKKVDEMVELVKKYTAPDVLEYVKQSAELNSLKKALIVTERKNKIYEDRLVRKAMKINHNDNKYDKEKQTRPKLYTGPSIWRPADSQDFRQYSTELK